MNDNQRPTGGQPTGEEVAEAHREAMGELRAMDRLAELAGHLADADTCALDLRHFSPQGSKELRHHISMAEKVAVAIEEEL